MAAAGGYRIGDEPLPGPLQHLAVNPLWPLLAVMFGGAWLSWPWFVLNAFAVGSPTRQRELAVAAGGLLATAVLVFALLYAVGSGLLAERHAAYALVAVTACKLAVTYWLYTLQSRCFGLYEYFGGRVRNGALVLVGGLFAKPVVLGPLPGLVQMVLA